jgi:hypothetical protein
MDTNPVDHLASMEQPPKRGYLRLEFISERRTRTILAGQVSSTTAHSAQPQRQIAIHALTRQIPCCLQRLAGLAAYGVMAWEIAAQ